MKVGRLEFDALQQALEVLNRTVKCGYKACDYTLPNNVTPRQFEEAWYRHAAEQNHKRRILKYA